MNNHTKLQRIIDRLDLRIEEQSWGNDSPQAVSLVSRYHDHVGFAERRFLPCANDIPTGDLANLARFLRGIVAEHAKAGS